MRAQSFLQCVANDLIWSGAVHESTAAVVLDALTGADQSDSPAKSTPGSTYITNSTAQTTFADCSGDECMPVVVEVEFT